MDKLKNIVKNRQHVINIVRLMLVAVERGATNKQIVHKLEYEYKLNNSQCASQNSLIQIKKLFFYIKSLENFDWEKHIYTNDYFVNAAIMICGGLDRTKNGSKSVNVSVTFYADEKLSYKMCVECVQKAKCANIFSHVHQYKQTVSNKDLYWFVLCYICDCCFINKLFV